MSFRDSGRRTASILLAVALSGCSLAPDYHVPEAAIPPAYREDVPQDGWVKAQPAAAAIPRGEWWRVFNDPILDLLEAETTDANQNLRAALAAFEQSQAEVQGADAALFPLLNADASSTRNQQSRNRPLFSTTSPTHYSDHIVSLDASYDIDVFGRLRNSLAAAEARSIASEDDLQTLNLSTHASLAGDYFQLREQDLLLRLYTQTIAAYRQALELTQQRLQQGISSGLDVAEAQTQLQSALAQADAVTLARARLEHAIALLVGEPASTFSLAPTNTNFNPPTIPAGLPSELLQRRPDIAAQERRVAAANADIGVAYAAFYPDFQFDLSGGYEGNHLQNWIKAPSKFWSVGPSGSLTIFDAGEREAILEEAGQAYDEAVADYRQSVLTGYQQTEDAIASIKLLDSEEISQARDVQAAQAGLDYSNQRYADGVDTFLNVVTLQTTLLDAQRQEAAVLADRINARVQLIQALGGGWGPIENPAPLPNPDPASVLNADKPGSIFRGLLNSDFGF